MMEAKAKALAVQARQKLGHPLLKASGAGKVVGEVCNFVVELAAEVDALRAAVAKQEVGGNIGA